MPSHRDTEDTAPQSRNQTKNRVRIDADNHSVNLKTQDSRLSAFGNSLGLWFCVMDQYHRLLRICTHPRNQRLENSFLLAADNTQIYTDQIMI